jgi:uncharacterized protein (TIGR02996 family)
MKPEEAGLLARVCAEPDDDSPRLIFADWLDEQGDPRGEFIRVQVAISRLPAEDPTRTALLDREATLLARHHARWSEPLRGVASTAEFRRGFAETVFIDAKTFLLRADELFQLAPVRQIRFLDIGSNLGRLMESPHLAQLSSVTIYAQHMGEDLTRALVDSPHLGELRSLSIGRNRVGDRGAERLAWSSRFRNLTSLDLSDNTIGDTGARAIASSSNLANLEALELRHNELSRAGLGALCGSTALTHLSQLGLGLNYVGALQERDPPAPGKVALKALDLSENALTPEGMRMLTHLPGLGELSRLVLSNNGLGNAGATTLSGWSGAASLESLTLAGNRIGDEGALELARSPYFFRLIDLDLSDNPIHDVAASEFLTSRSLSRLTRLGLPHLGLTPRMRRALAIRYSR